MFAARWDGIKYCGAGAPATRDRVASESRTQNCSSVLWHCIPLPRDQTGKGAESIAEHMQQLGHPISPRACPAPEPSGLRARLRTSTKTTSAETKPHRAPDTLKPSPPHPIPWRASWHHAKPQRRNEGKETSPMTPVLSINSSPHWPRRRRCGSARWLAGCLGFAPNLIWRAAPAAPEAQSLPPPWCRSSTAQCWAPPRCLGGACFSIRGRSMR